MQYKGKYKIFDPVKITRYPLSTRKNRVTLDSLIDPATINPADLDLDTITRDQLRQIAQAIVSARTHNHPVVVFTGGHLIKNGLSPLLIDLATRGLITLIAGNASTAIHDFELAMIGATSEDVPDALGKGQFGMANEFALINQAITLGHRLKLGLGESLGRMVTQPDFRTDVLAQLSPSDRPTDFPFARVSLLVACYQKDIPFTVHVGIGTDVIDQHPSFDPAAKGACSGRDFLIFTEHITRFTAGGVILNIGSAVTGPEVLLKAVSMAANVGSAPARLLTADFDLHPYHPASLTDESSPAYYHRDQKSIVTRIPQAFAGQGLYIQGNQLQTIPALYAAILESL